MLRSWNGIKRNNSVKDKMRTFLGGVPLPTDHSHRYCFDLKIRAHKRDRHICLTISLFNDISCGKNATFSKLFTTWGWNTLPLQSTANIFKSLSYMKYLKSSETFCLLEPSACGIHKHLASYFKKSIVLTYAIFQAIDFPFPELIHEGWLVINP
jgi:hypothetical protein